MIFFDLAIGFAGGLAVAIVGIPITLWIMINHLDEQSETLLALIRGIRNQQPPIQPMPQPTAPAAPSYWPSVPAHEASGQSRETHPGGGRDPYHGLESRGYDTLYDPYTR
jgi:hypothetical protein